MLKFNNGVGEEFISIDRLPPDMTGAYEKTVFNRRIQAGTLCCEYGHPVLTGDMHQDVMRVRTIELDKIVANVTGIDPIHEKAKLIGFMVYVRPFGPKLDFINKLINDDVPLRLGVRALKNSNNDLVEVVTFDFLPG